MKLTEFIKANRKEIDAAIKAVCPNITLNNTERELWINNDEGLYFWAKSCGVNL